MKKLLSLCLALVLLLGICPVTLHASAAGFLDVPAGAWFEDAVEYTNGSGLFKGTSADKFSPKGVTNRGTFVTVLGRLAKVDQAQYQKSYFTDVKTSDFFSPYVQWAASYEVVKGTGEYTYSPKQPVQRQQIAVLLYRFAEATGNDVSASAGVLDSFSDKGDVASYAKAAMEWAVTHKVLQGSGGKLSPKASATRAQVAQIFYNINTQGLFPSVEITREPIELPEPPAKPVSTFKEPINISTTKQGVALNGVELDPTCFDVFPVLANNMLYEHQSASSIAKNNGAYVAVNGAFFQSYSNKDDFLANWSTIVRNGTPLRVENAVSSLDPKPAFVIDSEGRASIEAFRTIMDVELVRDGSKLDTLTQVSWNVETSPADATPVIYTAAFGHPDGRGEQTSRPVVVSGTVARAAEVDENNVVTKVYKNGGKDLVVPKKGFLLVERKLRWEGEKFLLTCEPGDQLIPSVTEYKGSRVQDISSALSNGPTLVKNGVARTQRANYVKEGFNDSYIIDGSNTRMAIGVKNNGNVVIVYATATLPNLANAMKDLGCKDAMLLDGGDSRFLYVNGAVRVSGSRALNNMLIFKKK